MASERSARFLQHLDAQRRTLKEEVEQDVAPLRGLSLAERGLVVESVCRDAMAILRGRPDFAQALLANDPRSDESERTWRAAVERFRVHGRH